MVFSGLFHGALCQWSSHLNGHIVTAILNKMKTTCIHIMAGSYSLYLPFFSATNITFAVNRFYFAFFISYVAP